MGNSLKIKQGKFGHSLWIVAFFLVAQIVTQLHFSEYGFDSHSHSGSPCAFMALHESMDDDDDSALLVATRWEKPLQSAIAHKTGEPNTAVALANHSRAPPTSLLTI